MSAKPAARRRRRDDRQAPPPDPVNVIDGIPDRRPDRPWWWLAAIGAVFLAWVAFLIYCAAAGR